MGEPVTPWMSAEIYAQRIHRLQELLAEFGWTHLAVYGDREHFGNLFWCCGFDPRFEEAMLLVSRDRPPRLLVGNEGRGYAPASPAVSERLVVVDVCPELSLPDQPPASDLSLDEALRQESINADAHVGIAGWKPVGAGLAVPSFIADAFRFAAGFENVHDASRDLLVLRSVCEPEEVAYFEWTNTLASEGMKRVLRALKPAALDYDLLREAQYPGVPLGCHMTLKCGANTHSLASARGERVQLGGRFSCGICYWGANICRAGWAVEDESQLPEPARDYVPSFVFPYFTAMTAWLRTLRVGATGASLHEAVTSRFDAITLNAGHLIHYDEWLASPVSAGSQTTLQSGAVIQSDVIPTHPAYYSSRMEDGYAVADAAWREEFATVSPSAFARCEARRWFLREELGITLHEDVLPLSNLAGIVPPFLLTPHRILAAD